MKTQPISFKGPLARFILKENREGIRTFNRVEKILSRFDLALIRLEGKWHVIEDVQKVLPNKYTENDLKSALALAKKAKYNDDGILKDIQIDAGNIYQAAEELIRRTKGVLYMKNVGAISLK